MRMIDGQCAGGRRIVEPSKDAAAIGASAIAAATAAPLNDF